MKMETAGFFRPAVRQKMKARIVIDGPQGSGKSKTAIMLMRGIVGPEGRFAVASTDPGGVEWYHRAGFDVRDMYRYTPRDFYQLMNAAEEGGYDGLVIDSYSAFWNGAGGALERVEKATRNGNSFSPWKDVTPELAKMIRHMLSSPLHIIITLKVKTEYEFNVNPETGKKTPVRLGLAPQAKAGSEEDFDCIIHMSAQNHEAYISKTRWDDFKFEGVLFDQSTIERPGYVLGEAIGAYLNQGIEPISRTRAEVMAANLPETTEEGPPNNQRRQHDQPRRQEQPRQQQDQPRQQPQRNADSQQTAQASSQSEQAKPGPEAEEKLRADIEKANEAWAALGDRRPAWVLPLWEGYVTYARNNVAEESVLALRTLYGGITKDVAPDRIVGHHAIKAVRGRAGWLVPSPTRDEAAWLTVLMTHARPERASDISAAVAQLVAEHGDRVSGLVGDLQQVPVEERGSWVTEVLRSGWPGAPAPASGPLEWGGAQ